MNLLVIIATLGSPNFSATWMADRLIGQGHTVTYRADESAVPASITDYDAVLLASDVSAAALGTKYDSAPVGVASFAQLIVPHAQYATTTSVNSGTTVQTAHVLVGSSDPVTGPSAGTTTIQSGNATSSRWISANAMGAASVKMAAQDDANPLRIVLGRYETGSLMADGSTTAPGRRLYWGLAPPYTSLDTTGQTWFDQAVSWIANGPDAPVANAATDQMAGPGQVVTLSGGGTDTDGAVVSYAWTQTGGPAVTLSSASAQNPTFTAPSVIGGTSLTFSLVVTDSQGLPSAADTVTVAVASAPFRRIASGGVWVNRLLRYARSNAWS